MLYSIVWCERTIITELEKVIIENPYFSPIFFEHRSMSYDQLVVEEYLPNLNGM